MNRREKIKIKAIGDIHGALSISDDWNLECDLLLIAGDVCPVDMSHDVHVQRNWIRDKFRSWMENLPAKHIVWIGGNHDYVCEQPGFYRETDSWRSIYLQDNSVTINGIKIYGSPWVPNLKGWAFYGDDRHFKLLAENLPKADIYLLHGPPKGILDNGVPDWGSPYISDAIKKNKPKAVVFGHIHEGYGYREEDGIHYHNVAHMNELYEAVNPYQIIKIE